jgi:hypothetical protein
MPRQPAAVQIVLPLSVVERLRSHGAKSEQGRHGALSYTHQSERTLDLLEACLLKSDPRVTRKLPQEHFDLVVEVLGDPQKLESFEVQRLGQYLAEISAFAGDARRLGLDPEELTKLIDGFSFAEKLYLVDAAQMRHAPHAPRAPKAPKAPKAGARERPGERAGARGGRGGRAGR